MTALAGVKAVIINGITFNVVSDTKWSATSTNRETKSGQDRVHGFSETPVAPFMACKLRDAGGMSVQAFNDMTDATVQFLQANGKSIVGRNMWTVGVQEVDSMEGAFDVRFEGVSGSVQEQ